MNNNHSQTILLPIDEGLKRNYLTYAMSVIIGRYIPDVRDGLKPVHRRILYSMYDNHLTYTSKQRKSSKIVGEVLGNYHPHGDNAVYEALVRMAQDFSMRYPLIFGQGNFGSIDGDPAAAMRYTEAKLAKISDMLLKDIDKDTVDFIPNYDNTTTEPTVLPASYPNLLVNGSIGIAVAMSTNVPPHNLNEIVQATCALIDNSELEVDELMEYVKAPDFPTGGIIIGKSAIRKAYDTGKGTFYIRGVAHIEEGSSKDRIIITEIPYNIKKSNLIIDIANHVKDEVIKGISEIRDESNKDGIRVVIELKRNTDPQLILNQLYSKTSLQISFSINLLAIVDRQPKTLSLKEILNYFIQHRVKVIVRRAQFNLSKNEARLHIVEGLVKANDNLDEVIKLIRSSQTAGEAKKSLQERFELSEIQAQAILDLRLQKLTALEKLSLEEEKKKLEENIARLIQFLGSADEQNALIKEELQAVGNIAPEKRKSEIQEQDNHSITIEDTIPNNEWLIMVSTEGILKRTSLSSYNMQKRGGKGKSGAQVRGEESIQHMFIARAHDFFLIFTNYGNAYYLKIYEIPESSLQSRGRNISALLALKEGEKIASYVVIQHFEENQYVFFVTEKGLIKRTSLMQFINSKKRGITAINLQEQDRLLSTILSNGGDDKEIFITTAIGKALKMPINSIRPTGRTSRGVIGIRLKEMDKVVSISIVDKGSSFVAVTSLGYAKRVLYNAFTVHNRGTAGQIYYATSKETGNVVSVKKVDSEDNQLFIITKNAITVRIAAKDIRIMGRTARGTKALKLKNKDEVADCTIKQTSDDTEL